MAMTKTKYAKHVLHRLNERFGIKASIKQYNQMCNLFLENKFDKEFMILEQENNRSIWEIAVNDIICYFVWDGEKIVTILDKEITSKSFKKAGKIFEDLHIKTIWGIV